jgi:hypothetical protein
MIERPGNRPPWLNQQTSLLLTIVLAAVIVGAIWLGSRLLAPNAEATSSSDVTGPTNEWPTLEPEPTLPPPPTLTPLSTPAPSATPTPVPIPLWQTLSDLTIVELTLPTEALAEAPPDKIRNLFGTDQVLLHMVGKVKLGIDLSKIEAVTSGSTISVTLPPVTIQDVVPLPSQSQVRSAQQRWAFSQYEGLELQAMERGMGQLKEIVANNPGFYELGFSRNRRGACHI